MVNPPQPKRAVMVKLTPQCLWSCSQIKPWSEPVFKKGERTRKVCIRNGKIIPVLPAKPAIVKEKKKRPDPIQFINPKLIQHNAAEPTPENGPDATTFFDTIGDLLTDSQPEPYEPLTAELPDSAVCTSAINPIADDENVFQFPPIFNVPGILD